MSEYLLTDYAYENSNQLERNYLHQTTFNQGRNGHKTILLLSVLVWTGQE